MNFSSFFIIGLAAFGFYFLQTQKTTPDKKVESKAAIIEESDGTPFKKMLVPEGLPYNQVILVAPPNCPSDASKRAREIEKYLIKYKVPYVKTDNISFGAMSREDYNLVNPIMKGKLPIVMINGKGKNNPTIKETILEYRSAFGRGY